jgi:hypothetical protein
MKELLIRQVEKLKEVILVLDKLRYRGRKKK